MSVPFFFYILSELADYIVTFLHFENKGYGETLVYFYILVLVGLVLHFFTGFSSSKRYQTAVFAYSFFALLLFLVEFSHLWEALPIAILLACIFLRGYENMEEDGNFYLVQLSMFIPISMIFAKILWAYSGKLDGYDRHFPVVILMTACALTFSQRYFEKFQYDVQFQKLLLWTKLLSFFAVCQDLCRGRQGAPLLLLQTLAIVMVLGELFYRIIKPAEELSQKREKFICLVLNLVGIICWTESTPLGEFSVTSSILILLVGCVSIFLGFYQDEVEMRHFGLGLSILAVLKMVTVDISSTDSIIRVVALIFGAAVCFGISCVYNKIEPKTKKSPSEEQNTPPEG